MDLLAAGKERIVEEGAEIGVHTWCCVDDKAAVDLPKDHPAHWNLISYLAEMLGAKKGADFYFYTLKAAPHRDVHIMSKKEIMDWNLATKFIEAKDLQGKKWREWKNFSTACLGNVSSVDKHEEHSFNSK